MSIPAALQTFIDDELLRAPLLMEQTIEAAFEQLRKAMPALPPGQRSMAGDLVQTLTHRRQGVVGAYVSSLRAQAKDLYTPAAPAQAAAALSLALVDEAEVAVDVEMSRAIEAIKSVAEIELRALQTYI